MAKVYISLGTNIERERYVILGLNALKTLFGKMTVSSLFASEAVGFDGPEFYNLVVGADTNLSLDELVLQLKNIELEHGRSPTAKKYSPRTLDLDLLIYDHVIATQPAQLPRDEILTSAFVLWPLAELAGNELHPVQQISYQQLWQAFDKHSQKLTKVPLNWPEIQIETTGSL